MILLELIDRGFGRYYFSILTSWYLDGLALEFMLGFVGRVGTWHVRLGPTSYYVGLTNKQKSSWDRIVKVKVTYKWLSVMMDLHRLIFEDCIRYRSATTTTKMTSSNTTSPPLSTPLLGGPKQCNNYYDWTSSNKELYLISIDQSSHHHHHLISWWITPPYSTSNNKRRWCLRRRRRLGSIYFRVIDNVLVPDGGGFCTL